MRAVVQRVHTAEVRVDGERVGAIGRGLLVYLGIGARDTPAEVAWMAAKVEGLRIFEDEREKLSWSVRDVAGEVLVLSQFTLYGDVRKGRRPSFDAAMPPEQARLLYDHFCHMLRELGLPVAEGRFRAVMRVLAEVDGPVTILVDSERTF
ncbi:MAG TPA: D-aminoacyl-tRNA deacylase [Polyangiaceae bacterium]|nr:D-aminoacyl-tRNA deacylase [Polyangiaceae bacterium]